MTEKTQSFTSEQQKRVDEVLSGLVNLITRTINAESPKIQAMDQRPRQVWSEQQPAVFFPYVNQAMLEDLIHELEQLV